MRLKRLSLPDGERVPPNSSAKTACYLSSGNQGFGGDFQLQYKRTSSPNVFALAHRGIDDGAITTRKDGKHWDINFREFLDVVIDGPISLRSGGLGTWNVHGWVGPLESIPRAGNSVVTRTPSADTGPGGTSSAADAMALSALSRAESSCAVM